MIEIINCEQGSDDWFRSRMGIPTASEFSTVMASGRGGGDSKTRATYMRKLAGEIITGEPMSNYSNADMERGKVMEDEARNLYAMLHDIDPERVGFVRNGDKGASPDSFIGDRGGLEIKSALAHIQIERLELDRLPPEHKAQVQGSLWVCERDWWDFVSYCPGLPLLVKRITRDEEYIRALDLEVRKFNEELAALVDRITKYDRKVAA